MIKTLRFNILKQNALTNVYKHDSHGPKQITMLLGCNFTGLPAHAFLSDDATADGQHNGDGDDNAWHSRIPHQFNKRL